MAVTMYEESIDALSQITDYSKQQLSCAWSQYSEREKELPDCWNDFLMDTLGGNLSFDKM